MDKNKSKKGSAFTRRDFLIGFGGGALGTAVAPHLLSQERELMPTKEGEVPVFSKKRIDFKVNGRGITCIVEPQDTLLEILRDKLNLTGAKKVCDRGECGGCTVLLDGKPTYSCMFLAVRADGKEITTVEGLEQKDQLHPVQQAFIEEDGYQCGFCTSGFLMTSLDLLQNNSNPDRDEIKKALSGNLCRCGNYAKIYEAVEAAAKKMRRP